MIEDSGVDTITLAGPATLYESAEIRELLLAALSGGKDLRIDLETSGPWDLSGLQLLISCVVSGRKAGQAVRLIHVPRVFAEIADRAGLSGWLSSVTDSFL
jgi:ABC-type transporter Mla MlaB component